ncbi:hypothetical protein D3C80_1454400 [compost metagenome]
MRVPADHFRRHGLHDITECKLTHFLGDAGMENHLQQQVAELLAKIICVLALDGVRHLVGFFYCIGFDGFKGLHNIPWTTGFRLAQCLHDLDEAGNILRGFHAAAFGYVRYGVS